MAKECHEPTLVSQATSCLAQLVSYGSYIKWSYNYIHADYHRPRRRRRRRRRYSKVRLNKWSSPQALPQAIALADEGTVCERVINSEIDPTRERVQRLLKLTSLLLFN